MNLSEIRKKIDAVDAAILRLLNERAELAHEIGALKKQAGADIYSPEREEQLIKSLLEKNNGRLAEAAVRAIYREIMSASRAQEKEIAVAYFGPEATWTHQAARQKFGTSVRYSPQPG